MNRGISDRNRQVKRGIPKQVVCVGGIRSERGL